MSSVQYLVVLSLATLFYLVVFVSSIYVWRLSNLRWVWVGVGGATLLIALQRFTTLLNVSSVVDVTLTYPWINLLDLIIPVFLMIAAALTMPAIKTFNGRLEKAEEMQRALAESEAKYRALIESTDAGYVIIDVEGILLECNETYVRLTGRSSVDQVLGHNLA